MSGYAEAAPVYVERGWPGVLPVLNDDGQSRLYVPEGFTGNGGAWPTVEQIEGWRTQHPDANTGLRLPDGVIGLDVDSYGNKLGGASLHDLVSDCGPLPRAWMSSARVRLGDALSGIRLYRVPPGTRLAGKPAKGIEVIQHHHRFVRAWNSLNPRVQQMVEWWRPDGEAHDDDAPWFAWIEAELPPAWIERLQRGASADDVEPRDLLDGPALATKMLTGCPYGERDESFNVYIWHLRRLGYPEIEALALANVAWEQVEQPPDDYLPLEVVVEKVKRIYATPVEYALTPAMRQWALRAQEATADELTFTSLADVEDTPAHFLVNNVLLDRDTLLMAGAEKTLKSWTALAMVVAVASGTPLFGNPRFKTFRSGKVVVLTGEGSSRLVKRRIRLLATALDLDPDEIMRQVVVTDDVAPITSEKFAASLHSVVELHQPVLVILDPLYTYVGDAEGSDLFSMGPVYARAREVCGDRALVICVHFNKPGRDRLELTSITQAGGREFAPSWWLVAHAREPDMGQQSFGLRVRVGGREGYGSEFGLDVELPRVRADEQTGEIHHEGELSFKVVAVEDTRDAVDWRREIYQWLRDAPLTMTKADVKGDGEGVQDRVKAMNWLIQSGVVIGEKVRRDGDNHKVTCWRATWDADFGQAEAWVENQSKLRDSLGGTS